MMAGNTVMIRHNHQVPTCAKSIQDLFEEALAKAYVVHYDFTKNVNIILKVVLHLN